MPRAKRLAAKAAVAETVATPEPPKPPTCAQCSTPLTWRDMFYGTPEREGDDGQEGREGDEGKRIGPTCKRCHQRNARSRFVVAFHPATRVTGKGKDGKPVVALVTHNRAARRGHSGQLPLSMRPALFDPQIAPRDRKPTRAERRATARKRAAAAQTAA